MQSIIPMLMVTDLCLKEDYFDSYIIEEPELNLFPADQPELFYVLINKVMVAHKKQLAITTHSPHLLAALNNLILAQQLREMNDPELTQAVNDIIPAHLEIDTRQVSIYSLGDKFKEEEYCVNLIDTDTGLIPSEYQEAVLEDVSEKFKELWSLYNENISSEIGQE